MFLGTNKKLPAYSAESQLCKRLQKILVFLEVFEGELAIGGEDGV